MAKWTEDRMYSAELIHGPDSKNTDTYRLWDQEAGKMLDVPGWMVGDPENLELRLQAVQVIRNRLGIE